LAESAPSLALDDSIREAILSASFSRFLLTLMTTSMKETSTSLYARRHLEILKQGYLLKLPSNNPATAQAKVKIYVSKGRHSINLPSEFVSDSAFPFKPLEELVARIDGKRVVIERRRG
jgi:hypothetical protein